MSEQTHPEWGERRRRREEERRHVTGEQPTAAAASTGGAAQPPLSRRELRERAAAEAARAAEALAGSARQAPPAAPSPSGAGPAAQPWTPSRPAPRSGAAGSSAPTPVQTGRPGPETAGHSLSRRELRERAAALRAQAAQQAASGPASPSAPVAPAAAPSPVAVPRLEPDQSGPVVPPSSGALTPQARAAAIRAQAARAAAEREEAARRTERAQSARTGWPQPAANPVTRAPEPRVAPPITQAPGGFGADGAGAPAVSAGLGGNGSARVMGPTGASPAAVPQTPQTGSAVRRVVLPPQAARVVEPEAPVTPPRGMPVHGPQATAQAPAPAQPIGGTRSGAAQAPVRQPVRQPVVGAQGGLRAAAAPAPQAPVDQRPGIAQPAAAVTGWQPESRSFGPVAAAAAAVDETAPVAIVPSENAFSPVSTSAADRPMSDGARGAFVPARVAPVVGRPFGTVQAPEKEPAAAAGAVAATAAAVAAAPTVDTDEDAPVMPRWGSVTPGQAWTPAPVREMPTQKTAPQVHDAEAAPEEPEQDLEAPRHPYTWLHMIMLVFVAFVFGMLIFVVLLREDTGTGTQGLGEIADLVAWSRAAVAAGTGA